MPSHLLEQLLLSLVTATMAMAMVMVMDMDTVMDTTAMDTMDTMERERLRLML